MKNIIEYFNAYIFLDSRKFGKRIKKIRENFGLSQQAIADRFGRTKQQISHWELGKTKISLEDLIGFSSAFEVSIDYLLFGEE